MNVVIIKKAFGRISWQKLIKFEPDSVCPSFPNTLYCNVYSSTIHKSGMLYKTVSLQFHTYIDLI